MTTPSGVYPAALRALKELGLSPSSADDRLISDFAQLSQALCETIHSPGNNVLRYTARLADEIAFFLYAYAITRQPGLVVETGVASGYSSAVLLTAMEKSRCGQLVSIDYPAYSETLRQIMFDLRHFSWGADLRSLRRTMRWCFGRLRFIPPGLESGWAVPAHLRARWSLKQGESVKVLSEMESTQIQPDVFIHDSDHSYRNMHAEFAWAWPRLKPGGLLIADDVALNPAWKEFLAREQPRQSFVLCDRLGIAVKAALGQHSA